MDNQLLLEVCKEFIKEQRITCKETIYQTDRVVENSFEFIEKICDIVGYHPMEDVICTGQEE